jgi:U3 small nucleolar RNA-associated protein 24
LKKFAVKKVINNNTDIRLYHYRSLALHLYRKSVQEKLKLQEEKREASKVRNVQQVASSLFFKHNTALVPPYQIIVDTNFINFSIQNKLDIVKSMMDALYAECKPCITDCVMGELEKMGPKYRIALRLARDPRFERLPCMHKGTYADDCIVQRVTQHRCYLVATCDKGLKARLRKIPGVPIMYISGHKYTVEQMPEAYGVLF